VVKYIFVGQKAHNIIFIIYFYIGETKLEKKKGGKCERESSRTQVTQEKPDANQNQHEKMEANQ
jgi:hypothetical protein